MKHAFLILAHNNFHVLQALVGALDDVRNDIYLHIDKKALGFIAPSVHSSNLYIIDNPCDVRWGDLEQVKAEYLLLEKAHSVARYDYYHIISGTHYPLVSLDNLFSYFDSVAPKSVLSPLPWRESEINDKICRYHLCHYHSQSTNLIWGKLCGFLWRAALKLQGHARLRNKSLFSGKYSNWVSINAKDIDLILSYKGEMLKSFRFTLCADELFIPVIFGENKVDFESNTKLLFQKFKAASPVFLQQQDYSEIISSECLFARKFDDSQLSLINQIGCQWKINR